MKHKSLLGGVIAALSLLIVGGSAQTGRRPFFVSPKQLNVASLLPNPPADNSPAQKAESEELHHIQEQRQLAQVAHAKADDAEEDIFIFKDILGDKFTAALLPQTATLSAHVHSDEGVIVNPAKNFFKRLRPFNFDASIKPVCKANADIHDYGYPSGHSTTGYLEALTLIMITPEKRDAILTRADDYARSRVTCGVHYPSDVVASKFVAYAMMGLIMDSPEFQKELEAARTETRRVLGFSKAM